MNVGDTVKVRSLRVPELVFDVVVQDFSDTHVRGPYTVPQEDGTILDIRELFGDDAVGLFYLGDTHELV